MDGDALIGILMVVFWLLSSLAARVGRAMKRSGESQERPPVENGETGERHETPANVFRKALEELAEQMNVEVEVAPAEPPVASEHEHTPGWHDRTASEIRPTASEHEHTPGWHSRTASEVRRTASEIELAASEHLMTGLEHQRGDAQGTPIPALPTVRKRRLSPLAKRLRADLTGGPGTLARAVLLREILGPPVGLRSSERGR